MGRIGAPSYVQQCPPRSQGCIKLVLCKLKYNVYSLLQLTILVLLLYRNETCQNFEKCFIRIG